MPARSAALAVASVAVSGALSACGGGAGSGAAETVGGVSGQVANAQARVQPNGVVVASAKVEVSGPEGDRLTLRWGLVDAGTGMDSEPEQVVTRYRLAPAATQHYVTVRIPRPSAASQYLVHFALYRANGTFVAGADTNGFEDGG